MPHVFISYRRDDTLDVTGRLHADLANNIGSSNVFKDVGSIDSSAPFETQIFKALSRCEYLIIMIGPQWLHLTDENGTRRIDNRNDYVRREITSAIEQNLKLIPVLVGDTVAPARENLPADLQPILDWQFSRLRPDPDYSRDADRIIRQTKPSRHWGKFWVSSTVLAAAGVGIFLYLKLNTIVAPCTVITSGQIKSAVDEGYSGLVYEGNVIDLSSKNTIAFVDFIGNASTSDTAPVTPPAYQLRYAKGAEEHNSDSRRINYTEFDGDTPIAGELDIGIAEWQWSCGSRHTGWIKPPGNRHGWDHNLLDEYHFDKVDIRRQWQNKTERHAYDDDYDRVTIFNCATDAFVIVGERFVATIELRCDEQNFHYVVNLYDGTTKEPRTLPEATVDDVTSPEFKISLAASEISLPFSIAGGRRGYIYRDSQSQTRILRIAEQDARTLDLQELYSVLFPAQ